MQGEPLGAEDGPSDRPLYYTPALQPSAEAHNLESEAQPIILQGNLKSLTQALTKKETLDEKVERALTQLVEDSLDEVLEFASRLTKHRGSRTMHRRLPVHLRDQDVHGGDGDAGRLLHRLHPKIDFVDIRRSV